MSRRTPKQHWEKIYETKDTFRDVSWYQDVPKTSIDLILSTGAKKDYKIIDVGGGDSLLVDKLLEFGFSNLFVLDISVKALEKAKMRLGEKAKKIVWLETDILDFNTKLRFDVWHDRATFHFFTKKSDIDQYVEIASNFIKPGGFFIVSTFSENGPVKCSDLDITRYTEDSIRELFKKDFKHLKSFEEVHTTPFNTKQKFLFSLFKKIMSFDDSFIYYQG